MSHARLSPSSAHRWMRCWASLMEEEKLPPTSSAFADEGTAAHELAQWTLTGVGHRAEAYLGRIIKVGKRNFTVTKEMAGFVQDYADNILTYAEQGVLEIEVKAKLFVEGIEVEEDGAFTSGTSDARITIVRDREMQIHDLKYGMGVKVSAFENEQLSLYALMAIEELALVEEFDTVRIVIHQPRLSWLDEWVITREQLNAFRDHVIGAGKNAVNIANGKRPVRESDYQPGDKQCRFCRAAASCPVLSKKVLKGVMQEVADLDAFPDAGAGVESKEHISGVDHDQLGRKMDIVPLVEHWLKAVRAEVERRIFGGIAVPGYKLVQGKKGNREWRMSDEAEELLKAMRYRNDEMYNMKVISPAAAEKLIKKASPRRWTQVQQLIIQRDGQPSVAPQSDPRPALVLKSPVDEIENLDEGEDLV